MHAHRCSKDFYHPDLIKRNIYISYSCIIKHREREEEWGGGREALGFCKWTRQSQISLCGHTLVSSLGSVISTSVFGGFCWRWVLAGLPRGRIAGLCGERTRSGPLGSWPTSGSGLDNWRASPQAKEEGGPHAERGIHIFFKSDGRFKIVFLHSDLWK